MIKKIVFVSTLSAALALTIFTLWYRYGLSAGFYCSGNVNFYRESGMMRLSTKIFVEGDSGKISMNGYIDKENGQRENVSRTIAFKNYHTGARYAWVSDEILPSIDENISPDMLKQWFPEFYREKNNKVEFFINRINANSIMLSGEFVPYYVCTQRH